MNDLLAAKSLCRLACLIVAVLSQALCGGNVLAQERSRPNILIVLADDQGWGDLSCHGNTNLSTPHIDSLAGSGALFERFYVCPVCSPTRAEFLTGRYHPRGGVVGVSTGGERLNLGERTLGDVFKSAGYATALFGKWHNGSQYPYHPNARGFDEYFGFTSGHWGDYFSPPLEHNGRPVKGDGYLTDDFTNHALSFMEKNRDHPFLCYVAFNTPHSPMQVPDPYFDKFKNRELSLRYTGAERENLAMTRAALAMCENIDTNVGRMLAKLDELKLADRTLVLYFSDNGPNSWRWNGGMRGRKGSTDEGGVRSPLLVRWPGQIKPGTRVTPIAGAIDLLPTLADLAGVTITPGKPLDGISLAPLLRGNRAAWPERQIFSHWAGAVSVRTDQHRLDSDGRLYDMVKDPGQKHDISRQQPDIAGKLTEAVARWRREVLAGLRGQDRPFTVGYREFPATPLPARDGVPRGNIRRSANAPNCSFFTNWTSASDRMTWDIDVATAGQYEAVVYYTCAKENVGSTVALSFKESRLEGRVAEAHDPPLLGAEHDRVPRVGESYVKDFKPLRLGNIRLEKARGLLTLQAVQIPGKKVMDVRAIVLTLLKDDAGIDPSKRAHTDEELKEYLKPVPPKTPAQALASFETAPGFHMELVAHEPLVHSPVAGAFDENGSLYVAEMIDYPYMPKAGQKPRGTVRVLLDTDGDGVFDQSHVFADGLYGVSGIAPWNGGIFVLAPPDIWYLKDTDGDHHADVRRKVYTGFGFQNPQGMANNLAVGLDHKIYGTTSSNGGAIRPADAPESAGVRINGRDFRFDPVSGKFETITGTAQWGNAFDDWGNRFLCNESHPLIHAVFPQHYLARNPYLPVPRVLNDVAGGSVPIYRISPVEHWREIRSSRRIRHGERAATSAGASHHVVDAGAGLAIYRGGAYPAAYYGQVFTPDAQNNLIHHRTLVPDGATFKSQRVEDRMEFARSSDNWFRPVNALNAPDGTLYILDMSREILEAIHIPLDVLKFLDLRSGRDHGRIYRIAPDGFKYPGPVMLGHATGTELVKTLESPHGWRRDTAHRLIFERKDQALVEPLRLLLKSSALPQARLLALWSLQGLGALEDRDLSAGLSDPSAGVREHAMRLAEPRLKASPQLLEQVLSLARDPEPRIAFQLAFTLGEVRDQRAVALLATIADKHPEDRWMMTAVLSSAADCADRLFELLLKNVPPASRPRSRGQTDMLGQLAGIVGVRNRPAEVRRALDALASSQDISLNQALLRGLGEGLARAGTRLPDSDQHVAQVLQAAAVMAKNRQALEPQRLDAIKLLACAPYERSQDILRSLIAIDQPETIQVAAVRALSGYDRPEIADYLLENWPQYAPSVRTAVVEALLARVPWAIAFLDAVTRGKASAQQVDPVRREVLEKHANPIVAGLARKAFASGTLNSRKDVIADYQAALKLRGDLKLGQIVFQKNCMGCHRIDKEGVDVGPNLTASTFRDPGALMVQILDPNQFVQPKYIQYMAADRNGRTFTGIIANETATSVTLRRDKGAEDTILRANLEQLASTGKSLMPEGLEKQISKEEMAHLLAFVIGAQAQSAPLDRGTKPDMLVDP